MDELLNRLKKLDTTCVSDALDKLGVECCLYDIKPIQKGQKICGRAYTVHYMPCGAVKGTVGDFLDDVQPGQVVVIDNAGRTDCTVWGDIMAKTAKAVGIEGTVIDGVCRDIPAVLECGYPIFSKGYYMRTGDVIMGDDTGVLVIPYGMLEKVLPIAEEIDQKEQQILKLVAEGHPLREARAITGYHHLQTKQ